MSSKTVPVYETTFIFSENQDLSRIKSGMTANITISSGRVDNVLALPSSYVEQEEGASFVWVQDNSGDLERREVALGYKTNTALFEITSGLQEGETVVLLGK